MKDALESTGGRRTYTRRSDEERIADLERRIEELKRREAEKEAKKAVEIDPVLKEIPKVNRRVRKFAQLAMDHNRPDIANTASAFAAVLERTMRMELD
jgi:hypothetical protein